VLWTLVIAQRSYALGLGDPVKLDERCSLEAHSPNLPHLRQAFRVRVASSFFCSHLCLLHGAGKQSPRPPQRHSPQGKSANANRWAVFCKVKVLLVKS